MSQPKRLHPVMLAGTGSDVGKSILATALCRIFRQDGYRPTPFKAQNMALNSFVTPDGLEIGRAQAVQAEAAGLPCEANMNPLLLKPQSDHSSQVVVLGRPIGNREAITYWRREGKEKFKPVVHQAYDSLAGRYNPIVMEGAGSITELNLRDTDLVNMPMARYAHADVILVADIDRGGIFASAYGSIMLQDEEDRRRIKGIIVNKFRGDLRLFDDGRRMLEAVCGVPVLGVVPYLEDLHIDAEDSVALEHRKNSKSAPTEKTRVAVVQLPHISNFTDFDKLERDPRVLLFYTARPEDLAEADIIILPGTKSTADDLYHLRRSGMASAILQAREAGKTIMGICGGFQMMGRSISDPDGIEDGRLSTPGLGILPMETTMSPAKTTRQVKFTFQGVACKGYEIHHGTSTLSEPVVVRDNCIGTYIHGILDNAVVIDFLLKSAPQREAKRLSAEEERELAYDRLADHVRRHLDMQTLYNILSDD